MVDLSKPLSDSDRDYLLTRDRHEEVAFNAVVHDVDLPEEVRQSIRARGITDEMTMRRVRAARGEDGDAAPAKPVQTAQTGPKEPSTPDGPEKFSDEWFDTATVEELKPELKERRLPVSGTRAELVDRLYDKMVETGEIVDDEEDDNA